MNTAVDCDKMLELFRPYLEGGLPRDEAAQLERHIQSCRFCAGELEAEKKVVALLDDAFSEKKISDDFTGRADRRMLELSSQPEQASALAANIDEEGAVLDAVGESRFSALSGVPWWGVSVVLHGLVILLAGLISMAISLPKGEEPMVTVTELAQRPPVVAAEKPEKLETALHSKKETPPTDPTSKDAMDVIVPPDILAKAELSDHFETINPDRPDTHSAFGNMDAQMFHSEKGSDEPEGGGGNEGLTLEDMIGVGGASSPGSGGGWGGGNGSGVGVGTGSGHGSFGNRSGGGRALMVKRNGGSPATENAVNLALEWLARNQEADGSWMVQKHGGSLPKSCAVGISGLATLAFLGAGHTDRIGKYKDTVAKALDYLISQQNKDGSIGKNDHWEGWVSGSGYNHPIAGMALAEAFAMSRNPKYEEPAQSALYYSLEKHWNDAIGGWRYTSPDLIPAQARNGKEVDISVTGWFVMQLKSAKVAGLHVDRKYFSRVCEFIDTLKAKGDADDYGSHRYGYCQAHPNASVANTAMGMLIHVFTGTPAHELEDGAKFLLTELPAWNGKNGTTSAGRGPCPHYYWYYGTFCMFQMGGDYWKQWNKALIDTLVPHQCKDGANKGSWDMLGNDGPYAGRAYTTAMGCLALEVYYRYQRLSSH